MRVTNTILQNNFLMNLKFTTERLYEKQNQVLTNKRVNTPSDDPVDALNALNIQTRLDEITQYQRTITRTQTMLENTESVVESLVSQFQRVNTLVIQGASDSNTAEDKISISYEVNQILEQVVTDANNKTEASYIFAGTNVNTQPYTVERDEQGEIVSVTTNGTGGDLNRAIGENIQIKANINGEDLFERGVNLFDVLISIRDNLRDNDTTALRESLNDLSDAQEKVYNIQAVIGSRVNRVESAATRAESDVVNYTKFLSDAVDIDAAEAIVDYQVELQVFQSALQAGARLFQQSLIDFLS